MELYMNEELKSINRQVAQLEQQVELGEVPYHLLVESVKNYEIIMLDTAGYVRSWNPGAEALKGYTAEQIIGKHFSCFYTPEDIAKGKPEKILLKSAELGRYEVEGWRVRKDGSQFWANVVTTALCDRQGNIIGYSKMTRDFSDRKQAELEIKRALKKEQELNEIKSRFVSMVSHDFRVHLSVILTSSDLLKVYSDQFDAEKKLKFLDTIQTSVKNMNNLLEDVLFIGKNSVNKIDFQPVKLNIELFCREIIEQIELISGQKYKFIFKSSGEAYLAEIDEKLLLKILTNLLSNAVKYSPEGGNIYFQLVCEQEQVIFEIKDSGIGIPESAQAHLFEGFHRASNVGSIPGTGLGLAITKQAVDLHGGKIKVESQVGMGTTFTIVLPRFQH
jgi:PAS domain S-box-containing protein